jgi:membrane protein DedA with SNARE-associated domain
MEDILLFLARHGYPGLFLLLLLGIVGLPLPDELILAFAGFLIFKGLLHPIPAFLTAFAGTSCGITLSYALGRTLGLHLADRYGPLIYLTPDRLGQVQAWYQKRGKWVLLIGYFIAGVRHVTALVAGAAKLPPATFALFAYAGAFFWSVSFLAVGYFLGEQLPRVHQLIHHIMLIGGGIIVVSVVGYFLGRWLKSRRR